MRSVFSAGLFDGFLENHFNPFDFYIGVSGGASNLMAYLGGKPGESLRVFVDFAQRKEFISYQRFLGGGHLMDLDWLFRTVLSEAQPNLQQVFEHGKPLLVCATDVTTGKAVYIQTSADTLINAIRASTALPVVYRRFPHFEGRPMTDGGVADGIPVAEAIRRGATKVMVVRSRPKSYRKGDTLGHFYIRWKCRHHRELVSTMLDRVKIHELTKELICNPPEGVSIVDVCPPAEFSLGRFSQSRKDLEAGYEIGRNTADEVAASWRE